MFLWLFLAACCLQFTLLGAANFSVGQTFQIILSAVPDLSKVLVPDVNVWDIDVWDSDVDTIKGLQRLGKIVVCYFSAGTYEPWRNDSNLFPASDIGLALDQWPNERWLNIKSSKIRDIMKTRIQMAAAKGCDAIDPDNTDVDQNKNGLNINRLDAIDYIKYLSSTAASLNLKIGLKNSLGILADVQDVVHFAVNEECAQMQECNSYDTFLSAQKKPVFHIEYPAKFPTVTTQERQLFCQAPGTAGMSTVIKNMTLDGWVMYCDGKTYNTSTSANGTNHWGWPPPGWPTPTTIPVPPTTTRRSTTTARTTTTRATTRTSSSIRTTSTPNPPNPPGGCTVAHWGQCGGQDYHGCTVCVSGTTCKPVSPPWYYQCL